MGSSRTILAVIGGLVAFVVVISCCVGGCDGDIQNNNADPNQMTDEEREELLEKMMDLYYNYPIPQNQESNTCTEIQIEGH